MHGWVKEGRLLRQQLHRRRALHSSMSAFTLPARRIMCSNLHSLLLLRTKLKPSFKMACMWLVLL